MSKKDELMIKAQNLQSYLNVILASIVGVIGYIFVNIDEQSFAMNTISCFCVLVLFVAAIVVQVLINKNARDIRRVK